MDEKVEADFVYVTDFFLQCLVDGGELVGGKFFMKAKFVSVFFLFVGITKKTGNTYVSKVAIDTRN